MTVAEPGPDGPVCGRPARTPVRHMSVHSRKRLDSQGHHGTTTARSTTARTRVYAQAAGRFRRWWQVLGSNQRRLSRRFYSEPIPPQRNNR
jgi:hypothetical protein